MGDARVMTTLDAQCMVAHVIDRDGGGAPPEHWRHRADGTLGWRFTEGSRDFRWDASATAEVAAAWRKLDAASPVSVAPYIDAHRRLLDALEAAGVAPPDAVLHDLSAREITALWEDGKRAVVIDRIGRSAAQPRAAVG
jgi:hypothetical protein